MSRVLRKHRWAVLIVLLYLAAAILYGVTIPIFEGPDARGHYAYIHELTEGRGLPVQGTPSGQRVTGYVATHPPLYYALCAALAFWVPDDVDFNDWAWRNPYRADGFPGSVGNKNFLIHTEAEAFPWRGTPLTVHIARLVSAALGAVAVVGTYGTVLELTHARGDGQGPPYLALGAAALTAFNPMLVFTGARVSNDAAVAAFGSLVVWGATRLAVRGLSRRGLALLGAGLGLAALSKMSGVTLAPAVALALLLSAVRNARFGPRPPRPKLSRLLRKERFVPLLVDAVVLFGGALLVCGWWFARNLLLYGELLGVDAWLSRTATVRPEPIGLLEVIPQLQGLEMSYWAMFGWFNVPVAPWMYRAWWVLARLAVVGLGLLLAEQWTRRRMSWEAQAGLAVVASSFLLVLGSVWRFIMVVLGAQGRYLFPAVAAVSSLLMLGLARLVGRRGEGWLAGSLAVTHLAATVASLFLFILPTYAPPESLTDAQIGAIPHRLDAEFEGVMRLLGYDLQADAVEPGGDVEVILYWEALAPTERDYVVFVHLVGEGGLVVAQRDSFPGLGRLPTRLLEPGFRWSDRQVIQVPATAYAPDEAQVSVGVYDPVGGGRLEVHDAASQALGDSLLLGRVDVRPRPGATPNPAGISFEDQMALVGYELSDRVVRPGEVLTATLYWEGLQPMAVDYSVSVQLVDETQEKAAQHDSWPGDWTAPTTGWTPGETVVDVHALDVYTGATPGVYDVKVAVYAVENGQSTHLRVVSEGWGTHPRRVVLTQVRVSP